MDARLQQPRAAETWIDWAQARPIVAAAAVVAIGGAATILGAWIFQYLGYRPCPLCLEQRYPYYFAIPLAVFIILGETVGSRRRILLAALAVIAGLMLWNAGLGGYHAGVEWKWWPGPNTCGGAPDLGDRRQPAQATAVDQCRALRRGGVDVPRLVACGLQRADLAGARRRRGVGIPGGPQAAAADSEKAHATGDDHGSSSVSQ